MGTMLAPAVFCSLWILVFSHSAMTVAAGDGGALITDVNEKFSMALFSLLGNFPLSGFVSAFTLVLLVGFFVTSLDSGSLVVDMLAAKGKDSPVWQRIFWSLLEGALAITLLLAGGLNALQAGAMLTTVPFGLVIIGMMVSLPMSFVKESQSDHSSVPTPSMETSP